MTEEKVIHRELSYRIVGVLFDVYNEIGFGHKEKYYENAVAAAFDSDGLRYKRQVYVPLTFHGKAVGSYFLDFLVEDEIILELKQGDHFSRNNINQAKQYLNAMEKQLAILANFTSKGVKFKRILNLYS